MAITITVEDGPPALSVSWIPGMNVQDAIEAAQQQAPHPTFTFALQYYGPVLGYLVLISTKLTTALFHRQHRFFIGSF